MNRMWNIIWTPTNTSKGFEAQHHLLTQSLSLSPPDAEGKPLALVQAVKINGTEWINTLCLLSNHPLHSSAAILNESQASDKEGNIPLHLLPSGNKTIVLAHGFGAGLGFFYKNYQALSSMIQKGYNIYSIDWLGMGMSSRPKFPRKRYLMDQVQMIQEAEDFFIDSFEEWRLKMKIDSMVLVGHSLGGYLSTAYAERFPERVEKLVLISPVGVNAHPTTDELLPVDHKPGYLWRFVKNLWSWGFSPQNIIRGLGPAGPGIVKNYTNRRFRGLEFDELKAIEQYIFHISAQRGSGEYALTRLLEPKQKLTTILHPETREYVQVVSTNIYARNSLAHRLPLLQIPTTFLYGDDDWFEWVHFKLRMDHRHALLVAPKMKDSKVVLVHGAGHHLYLDNPDGFNHALLNEFKEHIGLPLETDRSDVSYL